jgi:hypothetical protein
MMTADDVVDAALARCSDLGHNSTQARSVSYRRIGVRQAQLFSRAADVHPEYFGVSATVVLTLGTYALAGLNPKAERVVDVKVANAGTSGLVVGDRVNMVLLDDADAMLAPRAVIRNQTLQGYGNDLTGVAQVTIHYARSPSMTVAGNTVLELPDQFQDLLVIDLARQMIRKQLDNEPTRRDGLIGLLDAEEGELLTTFDQHIRHFVYGEQRRFRPASVPSPAADNG